MKTLLIAEAGVNHNGSIELAYRLIDAAAEAGVDYVKFQTFRAESLASHTAQKAEYQIAETGKCSQQEMLKMLELPEQSYALLYEHCRKLSIGFLSTPFDIESIELLTHFPMPFWKIPSGEITNLPYLLAIAKTQKPVVMSTGMSEIAEIEKAMDVLHANGTPSIRLLHCNTEYPTPYEDVNLNAIKTLRDRFGIQVGYSDHTRGIEIPIAAVAMGATIIEKHFTLDRTMEGPDHKASLEPGELTAMVKAIRNVEAAMGSGLKTVSPSERKNIPIARKSIVAAKPILKGEAFSEENITVKRPGNGISPMEWFHVLGTCAVRDFAEDELIEL